MKRKRKKNLICWGSNRKKKKILAWKKYVLFNALQLRS